MAIVEGTEDYTKKMAAIVAIKEVVDHAAQRLFDIHPKFLEDPARFGYGIYGGYLERLARAAKALVALVEC